MCGRVSLALNLLLFSDSDRVAPGRIVLRDRRLQHLRQVHRANIGDTLRVGEIDGLLGDGEILPLQGFDEAQVWLSGSRPAAEQPGRHHDSGGEPAD